MKSVVVVVIAEGGSDKREEVENTTERAKRRPSSGSFAGRSLRVRPLDKSRRRCFFALPRASQPFRMAVLERDSKHRGNSYPRDVNERLCDNEDKLGEC